MARDIREGDLVRHFYGNRDQYTVGSLCAKHGCHLVARAERLAEVWPTDEAFRRFAAEVADAVQAAIWRGWKIAPSGVRTMDSCCPLGAREMRGRAPGQGPHRGRYPTVFDTMDDECSDFLGGFDSGSGVGPYAALGQAYRRRFVTGVGDQS